MSTLVDQALPCPHCGEQPIENAIEPHTHFLANMPDHPGSHVIECVCGAGMIDDTREAVLARWNRRASPPSSVQPEKEERRPLSDEMVLRAARELCKIHAGECQVNEQDTWNIYADQFKRDARAALEAAHGISPSPSMVGREGE